jgi:hypothetical protein
MGRGGRSLDASGCGVIVSVIPGRGNRDGARLAFYEKQAHAVGVAPHQLVWWHEFAKEELPFWETRLIDFKIDLVLE